MIYEWTYEAEQEILLRTFLREQGMSKRLLAKVKFHGGAIYLNGEERNVLTYVKHGDTVKVIVPDEGEHETTVPVNVPIEILFEDEHFLIVNKPSGAASIPSRQQPHLSMANRVKGYYQRQNYADQVIHVVTRLDRDTTGAMLFAKNRYAHSLMDKLLRAKELEKTYYALLSERDAISLEHGFINAPIGRTDDSIINRMVREDGKPALTEYWLQDSFMDGQLVKINLHTGRTHQIRVHFTHIGAPLLGDSLYGGKVDPLMERQALHCGELSFVHPLTKEKIRISAELPEDFREWMEEQKRKEQLDVRNTI